VVLPFIGANICFLRRKYMLSWKSRSIITARQQVYSLLCVLLNFQMHRRFQYRADRPHEEGNYLACLCHPTMLGQWYPTGDFDKGRGRIFLSDRKCKYSSSALLA